MTGITGASRTQPKLLIDNITLNNIRSSYTSESMSTDFYRNFILYIWVSSSGTPTNIVYEIEFSHDNTTWYKYTNDFFGDLRYEDTATASPGIYECVSYPCAGRFMRLKITGTGLSSTNTFTTKVYIEFYT
ncbi:MAG: hypothetical protein ACTSUF_03625 [Candidatus Heimdallarchaeaceae archaeon]